MEISRLATVHAFLEQSARSHPNKVALVQDARRATYGEINLAANRLARTLLRAGIAAGDRVAMLLENSLEYVVSYYGVLKAGAVAVPLNPETRVAGVVPLFEELQPRAVIASQRCEKLLCDAELDRLSVTLAVVKDPSLDWNACRCSLLSFEDAVSAGEGENPALALEAGRLASIVYTSGSTGKPKGVMLSHRNIVANTGSIVRYLELTERDVQMVVLPFFYVMGKSLLNTHFAVGGRIVINNGFAYPASVLGQMAAEAVTGFSGVPSTYAYLLHRSPLAAYRGRLASLRYCSQAGGHMARQIKEQLLETLPSHTKLFVMYGATEAAARLTYVEPEKLTKKWDSIGKPIPGVTVRVLDKEGNEVPDGQPGELVASGANIMQGYWRDAPATASVLSRHGYHTGDLGYRDQEGYLFVTGRRDDLLKVGGHRIDPQEVEDTLMATGLLLEAAVFGVEDALLGTRLVALAVPLSKTVTGKEILGRCLGKLPRHKLPSAVTLTASLPKHASGKIDRGGCLTLLKEESG